MHIANRHNGIYELSQSFYLKKCKQNTVEVQIIKKGGGLKKMKLFSFFNNMHVYVYDY